MLDNDVYMIACSRAYNYIPFCEKKTKTIESYTTAVRYYIFYLTQLFDYFTDEKIYDGQKPVITKSKDVKRVKRSDIRSKLNVGVPYTAMDFKKGIVEVLRKHNVIFGKNKAIRLAFDTLRDILEEYANLKNEIGNNPFYCISFISTNNSMGPEANDILHICDLDTMVANNIHLYVAEREICAERGDVYQIKQGKVWYISSQKGLDYFLPILSDKEMPSLSLSYRSAYCRPITHMAEVLRELNIYSKDILEHCVEYKKDSKRKPGIAEDKFADYLRYGPIGYVMEQIIRYTQNFRIDLVVE